MGSQSPKYRLVVKQGATASVSWGRPGAPVQATLPGSAHAPSMAPPGAAPPAGPLGATRCGRSAGALDCARRATGPNALAARRLEAARAGGEPSRSHGAAAGPRTTAARQDAAGDAARAHVVAGAGATAPRRRGSAGASSTAGHHNATAAGHATRGSRCYERTSGGLSRTIGATARARLRGRILCRRTGELPTTEREQETPSGG